MIRERGGGGRTAVCFVKVEIYTRGRGGGAVEGVCFRKRERGGEVWRKQEGSEWSAGGDNDDSSLLRSM